MGYRAEQLAQGRVGGDALAVAAGVDHKDAEIIKMAVAAFDFLLLVDIADHGQGSAAGTHTNAAFVRDHCKVSSCGKVILLDFSFIIGEPPPNPSDFRFIMK
mgnify:CR=1 FL=1